MAPRGITAIIAMPEEVLGSTPAAVDPSTGVCYINMRRWNDAHPDRRFFWLLHEMGHVARQTRNELEADRFASEIYSRFVPKGASRRQSVLALTDHLKFNKPEDLVRANLQFQRMKAEDDMGTLAQYHSDSVANITGAGDLYSLFGSKADRQRKRDLKAKKDEAKINVINAKADKKRDQGAAKLTRAEKSDGGEGLRGIVSKGIETAGNVVGGIMGAGGAARAMGSGGDAPVDEGGAPAPASKMPLIIGGVALLAVIVVVFLVMRKKKK